MIYSKLSENILKEMLNELRAESVGWLQVYRELRQREENKKMSVDEFQHWYFKDPVSVMPFNDNWRLRKTSPYYQRIIANQNVGR